MGDIIPQDMWLLIASLLEDKTKRQMRLVNTNLFNAIKYNNFTIYFTRKEDVPAITDRLSKYSWPIKLSFSNSKFDDLLDVISHLPKLTNLIKLGIWNLKTKHISLEQWMQLSVLTNLQDWDSRSPAELYTIFTNLTTWRSVSELEETVAPRWKRMSNLKNLSYEGDSTTWPFALVPNPEKLKYLCMITNRTMVNGADTWSRLTNLVHFDLQRDEFQNEIKLEYLTSLKLLSLNCKTIPSLFANTKLEYLSLYGGETLPSLAANTNLDTLYLDCRNWSLPNSEALARLVKLKELDLVVPTETVDRFRFLANLTRLEKLVMYEYEIHHNEVDESLYSYIPRQLRRLELYLASLRTDIAKLTHLTNLDSLVCGDTANAKKITALSNITRLVVGSAMGEEEDDLSSIGKMTQLQDLDFPFLRYEGNQAELLKLNQLTKLSYSNFPRSRQPELKHLTNLQNLCIRVHPRCGLQICDSFGALGNLTSLRIDGTVFDMESLWQNLAKLTKIQSLYLTLVDKDDRLLQLTSCTNLKTFQISGSKEQFTGIHFTALTSLQNISFKCNGAALAHKKEDLMKCMPYLLSYFH